MVLIVHHSVLSLYCCSIWPCTFAGSGVGLNGMLTWWLWLQCLFGVSNLLIWFFVLRRLTLHIQLAALALAWMACIHDDQCLFEVYCICFSACAIMCVVHHEHSTIRRKRGVFTKFGHPVKRVFGICGTWVKTDANGEQCSWYRTRRYIIMKYEKSILQYDSTCKNKSRLVYYYKVVFTQQLLQ